MTDSDTSLESTWRAYLSCCNERVLDQPLAAAQVSGCCCHIPISDLSGIRASPRELLATTA